MVVCLKCEREVVRRFDCCREMIVFVCDVGRDCDLGRIWTLKMWQIITMEMLSSSLLCDRWKMEIEKPDGNDTVKCYHFVIARVLDDNREMKGFF